MKVERYTCDEVIAAIRKGFTPAGAARVLGCHPDTIRNYSRRYTTVRHELLEQRAQIVDLAEIGLRSAVSSGAAWAITFALRTLAPDIYRPRHEITGADGGAVVIDWSGADPGSDQDD